MPGVLDKLSRIFTFGCSFTNYSWPTWADILGKQFDVHKNWGQTGAGNQFIYNAVVECHVKHTITPQDTVAIMWSSTGREDRYVKHKWITSGNIWNSNLYDKTFLDKFVDSRGFILRDLALMYGIKSLLQSIGCNHHMFSMVPVTQPNDYMPGTVANELVDVLPYYESMLKTFHPSIFEVVFDSNWDSREFKVPGKLNFWQSWYHNIKDQSWPEVKEKKDFANLPDSIKREVHDVFGFFIPNLNTAHGRVDYHPTPSEHLEYLDAVIPENNLSQDIRDWIKDCEFQVRNGTWQTSKQNTISRW